MTKSAHASVEGEARYAILCHDLIRSRLVSENYAALQHLEFMPSPFPELEAALMWQFVKWMRPWVVLAVKSVVNFTSDDNRVVDRVYAELSDRVRFVTTQPRAPSKERIVLGWVGMTHVYINLSSCEDLPTFTTFKERAAEREKFNAKIASMSEEITQLHAMLVAAGGGAVSVHASSPIAFPTPMGTTRGGVSSAPSGESSPLVATNSPQLELLDAASRARAWLVSVIVSHELTHLIVRLTTKDGNFHTPEGSGDASDLIDGIATNRRPVAEAGHLFETLLYRGRVNTRASFSAEEINKFETIVRQGIPSCQKDVAASDGTQAGLNTECMDGAAATGVTPPTLSVTQTESNDERPSGGFRCCGQPRIQYDYY